PRGRQTWKLPVSTAPLPWVTGGATILQSRISSSCPFLQLLRCRPGGNLPGDCMPVEIIYCVVKTNVLYDFSSPGQVIRQLAIFYFFTKQIAEYATKIFMARKGKKAS